MQTVPGFQVLSEILSFTEMRILRARRVSDGKAVVLESQRSVSDRVPPDRRHELALLRKLGCPFAVSPVDLIQHERTSTLVWEDFGGAPLRTLGVLGQLGVTETVELALSLLGAVEAIHSLNVTHRALCPESFWVNGVSGEVKIASFSLASELSRQACSLEGTVRLPRSLVYVSPEQTGRLNRTIDYRSDYYSFGVVLYELACGAPPFEHSDPLELAQCHVARAPVPLSERRRDLPARLSGLVQKLLAKAPGDRYQSLPGLRYDLGRCLDQSSDRANGEPLVLGSQDQKNELRLPEQLFGREAELAGLRTHLADVRTRGASLVLVTGAAGVGKSALVREACSGSTLQTIYFASGRFEQNSSVPYPAVTQAFRSLLRQLLTEPDQRLQEWRRIFRAELTVAPEVLASFCPELGVLLQLAQGAPEEPWALDARTRTQQALREFACAVAAGDRAVCVLLDDLQWADAASLEVIQDILHAARRLPLLVVAACRAEDSAPESIAAFAQAARAQGTKVHELPVNALDPEAVRSLLAHALQMSPENVVDLGTLLHRRTAGNPFFLRNFVVRLWQEGVLEPTPEGWQWDLVRASGEGITDNLVTVFQDQILALPSLCRDLLSWAACLGHRFAFRDLAAVTGCPTPAETLWPALEREVLVAPVGVLSPTQLANSSEDVEFSFAHEHLRQVLIEGLGTEERRARHWRIGVELSRLNVEAPDATFLFQTASHLGLGFRENATTAGELSWVAAQCLQAAEKATQTAAPRPALAFARTGIDALTLVPKEKADDLRLRLYRSAAQAAFLCGDFDLVEVLADEARKRGYRPSELARFRSIAGQIHYARGHAGESIGTCLEALSLLGIDVPGAPSSEQLEEARQSLEQIGKRLQAEPRRPGPSRPLEPVVEEAMEVLGSTVLTAYCTSHPAFSLMVKTLLELSLEHGECAHSSIGYLYYGVMAKQQGNYDLAVQCGRLALETAERFGIKSILSQVTIYAHFELLHWITPSPELSEKFQRGYELGAAVGSPFNAAGNLTTGCMNRFFAGDALGTLSRDMAEAGVRIDQYRQNQVLGWHQVFEQTVSNLHRATPEPLQLHGPIYDERVRVPQHVEAQCVASLYNYQVCKAMLCLFFGEYGQATVFLEQARGFNDAVASGTCLGGLWIVADCICHLKVLKQKEPEQQAAILDRVDFHQRRMELWGKLCPVNWTHRLALVRAERAHAEGDSERAVLLYAEAAELAHRAPFVHEAALTCELASQLHWERAEPERARSYLQQALEGYRRWEAQSKVRHLEKEHPRLLGAPSRRSEEEQWPVGTPRFSSLDLLTVLNASQAISREVSLDRLFTRLIELVIDAAGADAGTLLLQRGDRWVVEAFRGRNDPSAVLVGAEEGSEVALEADTPLDRVPVCRPVVRYVLRTGQPLVVDDALGHPEFSRDPDLGLREVKSLLCFPVCQQSKLVGIIYLENSLVRAAFTHERIRMLELLSAQAVISIQNARLYETLEHRVRERTDELCRKNDELQSTLLHLKDTQQRLIVQDRLASLGSMTAGIAHELRNPLNFVVNFARLAETRLRQLGATAADSAGGMDPLARKLAGAQECVTKIREHSGRIEDILQSMLQHSRGEPGTAQPTDINALVMTYVNLAKGSPNRSSVPLALELDPASPMVEVAPHDIGRALLNLINNACQAVLARRAVEPGFLPRVRVSTHQENGYVEIRVWDNGTGIPAEIGDKVFNPFFTTKPPGAGTGLGLSIAHDIIVQRHGGQLTFESRVDDHCEFLVRLRKMTGSASP